MKPQLLSEKYCPAKDDGGSDDGIIESEKCRPRDDEVIETEESEKCCPNDDEVIEAEESEAEAGARRIDRRS